jgi:hypothetical protein
MRLGISLGIACAFVACSSSEERTKSTSTGGSGGSAGSDAGLSLAGNAGSAGAPADECQVDADCVASSYPDPIASEADCYCVGCAFTPLGKIENEQRAAAWQTHCSTWATSHPCPDVDCAQPPMVFCQKPDFGPNRCATPDPI